jgi:hypothetical protein
MNKNILEKNHVLKEQLKVIKEKIENEFKNIRRNKINENDNENEYLDLEKNTEFKNKIDNYKDKIENLNFNLTNSEQCLNVIKNEDFVFYLKNQLIELKKENEILLKINKQQDTRLKENNDKINIPLDDKILMEKCKNLKDEIKIIKDYNMIIEKEIKIQDNEINKINDYCKLINENIQNKKNSLNNYSNNIEEEIDTLTKRIKQDEILLINQENTYKKNIRNQNDKIGRLTDEIKILKIQIESTKKDEKINLLKYKELEKFNNNYRVSNILSPKNKPISNYNFNPNLFSYRKRKSIPFEIGKFRNKSQENIFQNNKKKNNNKLKNNSTDNIKEYTSLKNNFKLNSNINLNNKLSFIPFLNSNIN